MTKIQALILRLSLSSLAVLFLAATPAYATQLTTVSQVTLTDLVNRERQARQLAVLTPDLRLQQAAQKKAEDILSRQYFEHYSPDGRTPWDFMLASGYDYQIAGENLAMDFTRVEDMQKAWMQSPTHAANILNPGYQNIGIGTISGEFLDSEGRRPTTIVVEMFGRTQTSVAEQMTVQVDRLVTYMRAILGL